jgi:hypothetical protein
VLVLVLVLVTVHVTVLIGLRRACAADGNEGCYPGR